MTMLLILLICLLSSNAISVRRDKSILYSRVVVSSLIFACIIALNTMYIYGLEKSIGIYGGLFHINLLTHSFNIFILLVSSIILLITSFYPRKVNIKEYLSLNMQFSRKFVYNKDIISNKTGEQFRIIEYPLIIVFILCGGVFLMSTGDIISLFLAIELQSYGLYILSSIYRDSESATGSGLTYFLLGGLSSCFILLGSALLYANSGTTNLENIFILYNITDIMLWYDPLFLDMSLIIIITGFLFKISAAPFHFWSPDVYDGVPTIVTTYIAIIAKISIFVLFIDLLINMDSWVDSWKVVFFYSSFLSFFIGSVLGLSQYRIKRLLAYSTISHVGFILLGLCTDNMESMQASIFYIFQYTIANLNTFFILLCIGYSLFLYTFNEEKKKGLKDKLVDENNSPIQLISQIKGYFYINSFMAISLAITLFSFIGVPPMAGFFAKQMILSGALDRGRTFMVLVAILTSVIGAVYYLNLVKEMFFFQSEYKQHLIDNISLKGYLMSAGEKPENGIHVQFNGNNITLNSALTGTISIITMLLLLFIYIPEVLFNIVGVLTLTLYK